MKEEEGRKNKDYKEIKEGERKDPEERILRIEENERKEKIKLKEIYERRIEMRKNVRGRRRVNECRGKIITN